MVQYELVTSIEDNEAWDVIIQSGYYEDTVVRFNSLAIDEEEESLKFDYSIVSSPIADLDEMNEGLQEAVKQVLAQVLEEAITEMETNPVTQEG
jgi:hypothetical protein